MTEEEEYNEDSPTFMFLFFIALILIVLFLIMPYLNHNFLCPDVQLPKYDKQLEQMDGKLTALSCKLPQEKGSYNEVRCTELLYEYNSKVKERNDLSCVRESRSYFLGLIDPIIHGIYYYLVAPFF